MAHVIRFEIQHYGRAIGTGSTPVEALETARAATGEWWWERRHGIRLADNMVTGARTLANRVAKALLAQRTAVSL
jgi:hypothetical protein